MTSVRLTSPVRLALLAAAAFASALLAAPKAAHAMTISPPQLDFTLSPGDVISDVVQIYNEEAVPFKVTPFAVNFYVKADDEISGAPDFYGADETRNGFELAPWFEYDPAGIVVMPNQRVNIPFSVRVPQDAQPGSHFGAIQIVASKPDDVANPDYSSLSIERGTTVLVFARVAGDAKDGLKISEFGAQKGLLTHLPADFTIRLKNDGTTHLRPVGNIIIEDMFGRQAGILQVNPGPQYKSILPATYRRFDASWSRRKLAADASEYVQQLDNFAFGKYTATLLLNYGSASRQQNLTAVTTFWVIPWMVLSVGLVLLIVAIALLKLLLGWYKRRIIRQFQQKQQ